MAPDRHSLFYSRQRFTLNLTRADMRRAGYSPSVRLFEAAACGTPIISDDWIGLDEVLTPNKEILLAHTAEDVTTYLQEVSDADARRLAMAARERISAEHSSARRAAELESYLAAARTMNPSQSARSGHQPAADRRESAIH
jgi:spore maturation protein CgeB